MESRAGDDQSSEKMEEMEEREKKRESKGVRRLSPQAERLKSQASEYRVEYLPLEEMIWLRV